MIIPVEPIRIEIGGPDDPFPGFPSSTSARARRHYVETGKPLVITTYGHHVISFIENNCVLTDAHYAGQPFNLMPWQKRALLEMFEVKWSDRFDTWIRRYKWVLVGIPKKNGKTEITSAIGIYLATDDNEPSARVVCAAASDDQANLLFGAATKICDWSSTLSQFTTLHSKHIAIDTDGMESEVRRVAAVSGSNDGKNLSATLVDELHEWVAPKSRSVFTVLTQAGGARRQPINIMITTAGSDQDSLCYEFYTRGQAMISDELEDDSFYFLWFEAPPCPDDEDPSQWYKKPEVWEAANPSWGLILQQEFYEDIITKRSESEFCRYFLNMWMESDEIWEAAQYWPNLGNSRLEMRSDLPAYVGIDVGRRHDSASIQTTQWTGERLLVRSQFWFNPYAPGTPEYFKWSLDIALLEKYCKDLYEEFPTPAYIDDEEGRQPGPKFLYDPHFFVRSAQMLAGDGLTMVEFPQTDSRMVPASQNLFELIKTGQVEHDDSRMMTIQMRTVVAVQKERGWRIGRPEGRRKHIDGPVALAMAAYAASAEFDEEDSGFNIW